MDEREKMLKGELYDANYDVSLFEERIKCKDLCFEYNQTKPSELKKRTLIIQKLLGKTGKFFHIEQPFYCDYGKNIEISENFYSIHNLIVLDANKVIFGDNVFIGPNCAFYPPEHPLDAKTRNKGLEYAKPINIGNNVWLGGGVTVLGGVTIGNNVVVAAGAVVTKDIPNNCLVAGVPAKKIKDIT